MAQGSVQPTGAAPRDEAREAREALRELLNQHIAARDALFAYWTARLPNDAECKAATEMLKGRPDVLAEIEWLNSVSETFECSQCGHRAIIHFPGCLAAKAAKAVLAAAPRADHDRLLESKQAEDWQTIKAECDSWWIAAIADEAPFVVTRITKRVEAYAAARAPGGAE